MKKLLLFILALVAMSACTTVREVPVDRIKTEYIVKNNTKVDTFLAKDSVFIREKGDTVWLEKYKTIYKTSYVDKVDTIIKSDTVPVIVNVPAEFSFKQKIMLDSWWILAVAAGVGVVIIIKRVKQIWKGK